MSSLLALSARRELACDRERALTPVFWQAAIFLALVWVPVTGMLWWCYPDWELSYIFEPAKLPPGVGAGIALAYFVAGIAGVLSTQALIQEGRTGLAVALTGAGALVLGGIFVVTADQLDKLGTYATYHAGTAPRSIDDARFVATMLGGGALVAVVFIGLLVWNVRRGRSLGGIGA